MENLRDLITNSVEKHGAKDAFIVKNKKGEHIHISYIRFYEEIRCLVEVFASRGYLGKRVAMIGKNSYEWFLANMAIQLMGGVTIPLDKELKILELEECLERSKADIIFCDEKTEPLIRKIGAGDRVKFQSIINLYTGEREDIRDLVNEGKNLIDHGANEFEKVEISERETSFLIFTSGTTSNSKVVMLSQRNIYKDVENTLLIADISHKDVNFSLLPYHHMLGSIATYLTLATGGTTVFCDGLKYLQKNMKEYKVTNFLAVPLILEAMYKKVMKTVESNGMSGKLNAIRGITRGLNLAGIRPNRKIFKGILEAFGGELRFLFVGGAPCNPEVIKGFQDFGIQVIQGYGLTETSPVIAGERPKQRKIGSVGFPLRDNEIVIENPDEDGIGEIVVRGPNVMQGYYENHSATKAVLNDGWLRTGDLGYFDKDGFLFITGRTKSVIVLKNGKNVFPEEMEIKINDLPYCKNNIIVGLPNDGDKLDLVVSLKIEYDGEFFKGKKEPEIREIIKADIEKINDTMPSYKRIKRIFITDKPMEMTTTSKVKRHIEIEKMLEEEASRNSEKNLQDK